MNRSMNNEQGYLSLFMEQDLGYILDISCSMFNDLSSRHGHGPFARARVANPMPIRAIFPCRRVEFAQGARVG